MIRQSLNTSSTMTLSLLVTFLSNPSFFSSVIQLFLLIVFAWLSNLCSNTRNIPFCSHKLSILFLYPLILGLLNKQLSIMILFSWVVHFLLLLLMKGFAWWPPMFPCQEHLPDEGPSSASWDPFMLLLSISLLDIFTHNNWGLGLRCLPTSIFIETTSLQGLPTKAKKDPSPHEMRLSPAGH